MQLTLYEALFFKLRSEAGEAAAAIEVLLKNPESASAAGILNDLQAHLERLTTAENAVVSLEKHFREKVVAARVEKDRTPDTAAQWETLMTKLSALERNTAFEKAGKLTPEMSPTFRKSLEQQKIREKRQEESNEE